MFGAINVYRKRQGQKKKGKQARNNKKNSYELSFGSKISPKKA